MHHRYQATVGTPWITAQNYNPPQPVVNWCSCLFPRSGDGTFHEASCYMRLGGPFNPQPQPVVWPQSQGFQPHGAAAWAQPPPPGVPQGASCASRPASSAPTEVIPEIGVISVPTPDPPRALVPVSGRRVTVLEQPARQVQAPRRMPVEQVVRRTIRSTFEKILVDLQTPTPGSSDLEESGTPFISTPLIPLAVDSPPPLNSQRAPLPSSDDLPARVLVTPPSYVAPPEMRSPPPCPLLKMKCIMCGEIHSEMKLKAR